MARHTIILDSVSISAAKDLVRITAARAFALRSVTVRADVSEVSDKVMVGIYRASTEGTGTATAPLSYEDSTTVFAGTAVTDLTADTTKVPAAPLVSVSVDLAGEGFAWAAYDGTEDIDVANGHIIVVRLESAPAGATVLTCVVEVEQ